MLVLLVPQEEPKSQIAVAHPDKPNNALPKETTFVTKTVTPQLVSHVALIVLNVMLTQAPVPFVLETESTPQNVSVQKDIMIPVWLIVQSVPPNVLLVNKLPIIVLLVPKEELTLQSVTAQKEPTSMELNVLLVLTNVLLVPLMKPVSLVLTKPDQKFQFVNVWKDTLTTVPPNVQLVKKNVTFVKTAQAIVLFVLEN